MATEQAVQFDVSASAESEFQYGPDDFSPRNMRPRRCIEVYLAQSPAACL